VHERRVVGLAVAGVLIAGGGRARPQDPDLRSIGPCPERITAPIARDCAASIAGGRGTHVADIDAASIRWK